MGLGQVASPSARAATAIFLYVVLLSRPLEPAVRLAAPVAGRRSWSLTASSKGLYASWDLLGSLNDEPWAFPGSPLAVCQRLSKPSCKGGGCHRITIWIPSPLLSSRAATLSQCLKGCSLKTNETPVAFAVWGFGDDRSSSVNTSETPLQPSLRRE